MKATPKKSTMLALGIALFLCILLGTACQAVPYGRQLPHQRPKTGPVEEAIRDKIHAYGLSSGEAAYLYTDTNYYGERQVACSDERYTYTFDGENNLVSLKLNSELRDGDTARATLPKDAYIARAEAYMKTCLPFFQGETTTIACTYDASDYSVYLTLADQRGDCLVNTGTVILTGGGTLQFLSGTSNTLEDFHGTNGWSKADIEEIVYQNLLADKDQLQQTRPAAGAEQPLAPGGRRPPGQAAPAFPWRRSSYRSWTSSWRKKPIFPLAKYTKKRPGIPSYGGPTQRCIPIGRP